MTLTEIRAAFPDLFYEQEWFRGETFMERDASPISPFIMLAEVPNFDEPSRPVRAVDLAALYVKDPERSEWRNFLWTDDTDAWGNRVYIGGVGMYGIEAFQIHRKLEPTAYWVRVP